MADISLLGALSAGAGASGRIVNSLSNILNGQNSQYNSTTNSEGTSWENSYGANSSWNKSYGEANSFEESNGYSMSNVYGSEASAKDMIAADKANEIQYEFMKAQHEMNEQSAKNNRDWQQWMSATSYARAVEDLIRSGLNPILAASNMGAATPGGAYASTGLANSHKAQTFANSTSYAENHGHGQSKSYNSSSGGSQGYSAGSGGSSNTSNSNTNSYTDTQLKSLIDSIGAAAGNAANGAASGATAAAAKSVSTGIAKTVAAANKAVSSTSSGKKTSTAAKKTVKTPGKGGGAVKAALK